MCWRLVGRMPETTSTRSAGGYRKLAVGHFHWSEGQGGGDSNRQEAVYEALEPTKPRLVGQRGLEPRTSVLSGLRSNRLSYWPKGSKRMSGDIQSISAP